MFTIFLNISPSVLGTTRLIMSEAKESLLLVLARILMDYCFSKINRL